MLSLLSLFRIARCSHPGSQGGHSLPGKTQLRQAGAGIGGELSIDVLVSKECFLALQFLFYVAKTTC